MTARPASTLPAARCAGPRGWDSSTVAHPDVDAALHRSFLGTLPADVVERLTEGVGNSDHPS